MAIRRVMHLENQVRPCGDKFGHAVRPAIRFASWCIDQQHVAGGCVCLSPFLRVRKTRGRKWPAHRSIAQPLRSRRTNINHRMMHVLAARGPNLRHLHPLIFGESCGHDLVGVFHVPNRGKADRLWHLHDFVRLRDVPSFDPVTGRRSISWRSCRRTSIHPSGDNRDLLRSERWVVGESSVTRVGKPGRHLLRLHRTFDGRGPGSCLLVGYEGHGRNLAFAMADLAVILQDGHDVPIKRRPTQNLFSCRGRSLGLAGDA